MMKTGKNKRLLASILAASVILTMAPFAFAADEAEQVLSATVNEAIETFEGDAIVQDDTTAEEGTITPVTPENAAKIGDAEYSTVADALAAA